MELFPTIGNGRKLDRANMQKGSWIYPWFLHFSSLCAINFSTQYKYQDQANFLMKVKPVVYYKVLGNFTSQLCLL